MHPLPPYVSVFVAPLHILHNIVRPSTTYPLYRFTHTKSAAPRAFPSMAPTGVKKYDYVVIGGGSGGSGYALAQNFSSITKFLSVELPLPID